MNTAIYNPQEEYQSKFKNRHSDKTAAFFDELVKQSGIDIEVNRATVKSYNNCRENSGKIRKKYNLFRFLRVIMCITIVLIPLVILKVTPKIRALREEMAQLDQKADELMEQARQQMAPLNALFTDRDGLNIIESVIPTLSFDQCFSQERELNMRTNFDFCDGDDIEESTVDVLSGEYNENPFLFENKLVHTMGTETYHGQLVITWTETYRDSDGKLRTRVRTETLHASVVKPKPFFGNRVVLHYGAQGGPELCFSRTAAHHERKSEKEVAKLVKKGEKKLKKMTDKALSQNKDFMAMSNTDFEVLFSALDRNDEVGFRTLFTPLAQTNITKLMLDKEGYGDDFNFFKINRMNKILTEHSQGRPLNLVAGNFWSYSYDIIHDSFVNLNEKFFKDIYFDFAPLWAIPVYQERPVHSLDPLPDYDRMYSQKECEALANCIDRRFTVHPNTKTEAILKSRFVVSRDGIDQTQVTAYSYDIFPRIDLIPVRGGDGHWHNVPVPWDEYIPLEAENLFYISESAKVPGDSVIGSRDGLSIYN